MFKLLAIIKYCFIQILIKYHVLKKNAILEELIIGLNIILMEFVFL